MTPAAISHLPPGTPWWMFAAVIAALALHIGGGSIGILSGYAAVTVRKGERLHRRFGAVFLGSMLIMAVMATLLAILNRQSANLAGGILAGYLVASAWMTVRRPEGHVGLFEKLAFVVVLSLAVTFLFWGLEAASSPKRQLDGSAPAFFYVFGSVAGFIAALDLKVILQGGVSGPQRIARHLWRMCFALFFAAGSFFLGQQKVMPAFMHGSPFLFIPAFAPLVLMIFWLIRVRVSRRPAHPKPAPA